MSGKLFVRLMVGIPASLAACIVMADDPVLKPGPTPQAPPTPPPVGVRPADAPTSPSLRPMGPTVYSIGEPTDEEQLYLEYINRARANPPAEGQRLEATTNPEVLSNYEFFEVNLALMMSEFAAIDPAPPLSFNAQMIQAARLHSADMETYEFQGHYSWNPNTGAMDGSKSPGYRLTQAGYTWQTYGENVFSRAEHPFHGHAGFEVDWGYGGTGGMQEGRGHRTSIHNAAFREIGIGVMHAVPGKSVGPQLVTQDFATALSGVVPFVTGVVYYDLNENGFYDVGEGLGGVVVDVAGSGNHAVTATSGGYSVPVPQHLTHTVTFSATNVADQVRSVPVEASNVKVDLVLPYTAPEVAGPIHLGIGAPGSYTFTTVGGATNYAWYQATRAPHATVEGAENGSGHLRVDVTPGYAVVDTQVKATGAASFHLAMPEAESQTLELDEDLLPGPQGELRFASRLGLASATQVARAQISLDDGATWSTLWSRAGNGGSGQSSFETVTVPLSDYANRMLRVRFVYAFTGGSYYPGTNVGLGWYLDDIQFSDVSALGEPLVSSVTQTQFSFSSNMQGEYLLWVQPHAAGRWFPVGPLFLVDVSGSAPPTVRVADIGWIGERTLGLDCVVENGPASAVHLEFRDDLSAAWAVETEAQILPIEAGTRYQITVPIGAESHRFYQVVIDP